MTDSQELKAYLKPGNAILVISLIIAAVTILLGILVSGKESVIPPWLIFAAGAVFTAVFFGSWLSMRKAYRKLFGEISKADLDDLSEEFNKADKWFGDSFRTGEEHIFQKGDANLITYGSIENIYEHVKTDKNHKETGRVLRVVTKDNRIHDLCLLQSAGRSRDEVRRLQEYVKKKNPSANPPVQDPLSAQYRNIMDNLNGMSR